MPFIYESDRRQREQLLPEAVEYQEPASFGETYTAAFRYAMDEETSISGVLNRQGFRQREDEIKRLIDEGIINRDDYTNRRGRLDYNRLATEFESVKSDSQLNEERREFLRQRREEAEDIFERGSGAAQFLGMASAFAVDPINLATLPISSSVSAARGLSWVGRALLTARREAALSTAAELAIQPLVYQHKSEIESPYSWQDAVTNIGLAAAGSAALGFAAGGVAGYLRNVQRKTEPFLDPKETDLASRSFSEIADYLEQTKPDTVSRIIDEEYGKFIENEYASLSELKIETRNRLEAELRNIDRERQSLVRIIADQGGLNRKAWQDIGLDVNAISKNTEIRNQLPKNKPMVRRTKGSTPEELAERLDESGFFPEGKVSASRAIEIVQTAIRNPEAPVNPELASKAIEIENTIAKIDSADDETLESIYKQAQEIEIESDLERLRELERNREQMEIPSRQSQNYDMPEPERVAPQTITERQREVINRLGLAEDYDRAIEDYKRLETKRVWDEEEGRFVDADEVMDELDEEIEGLNEVLRCTVDA